ncbi:hypothetical protein OIO90_004901 [Microbotryomycetes sp. JL221]|nr:hypothetical protein OIO90_004901 [Microbotryomycetes sp. JL221]
MPRKPDLEFLKELTQGFQPEFDMEPDWHPDQKMLYELRVLNTIARNPQTASSEQQKSIQHDFLHLIHNDKRLERVLSSLPKLKATDTCEEGDRFGHEFDKEYLKTCVKSVLKEHPLLETILRPMSKIRPLPMMRLLASFVEVWAFVWHNRPHSDKESELPIAELQSSTFELVSRLHNGHRQVDIVKFFNAEPLTQACILLCIAKYSEDGSLFKIVSKQWKLWHHSVFWACSGQNLDFVTQMPLEVDDNGSVSSTTHMLEHMWLLDSIYEMLAGRKALFTLSRTQSDKVKRSWDQFRQNNLIFLEQYNLERRGGAFFYEELDMDPRKGVTVGEAWLRAIDVQPHLGISDLWTPYKEHKVIHPGVHHLFTENTIDVELTIMLFLQIVSKMMSESENEAKPERIIDVPDLFETARLRPTVKGTGLPKTLSEMDQIEIIKSDHSKFLQWFERTKMIQKAWSIVYGAMWVQKVIRLSN